MALCRHPLGRGRVLKMGFVGCPGALQARTRQKVDARIQGPGHLALEGPRVGADYPPKPRDFLRPRLTGPLGGGNRQGGVEPWRLKCKRALQVATQSGEEAGKIAEVLENECTVDFFDLNCGCPLDAVCNRWDWAAPCGFDPLCTVQMYPDCLTFVCNRGMGAGMMETPAKLREVVSVSFFPSYVASCAWNGPSKPIFAELFLCT